MKELPDFFDGNEKELTKFIKKDNSKSFMEFADLHCHTKYSDGDFSPKEVIKKAKKKGLKCLAVTDHNSTEGIKEAVLYGKRLGIEIIPGVEITSEWGEVIGYHIDVNNKDLKSLLAYNRKEIDKGARECIKILNKKGLDVSYRAVKLQFRRYPLMCFLIFQFLVKKGKITLDYELFKEYLKGKIKYKFPTTGQVISVIKKAGGIAVLAHPFAESNLEEEFKNIKTLVKEGLAGIEIENGQYQLYDSKIKNEIFKISKKHGLILTSGSDFHGDSVKSELGSCTCSKEVVQKLKYLRN